jgi:cytochrome c oxidase subunit 2
MTKLDMHHAADMAERTERRWATICVIIIVGLVLMVTFAGIHQATMPQPRVETIDPTRLHLSGEFVESNLGAAAEPDGAVTVRAIGQQYSFTPSCILVPAQTAIVLRATSADVVHGMLIQGTRLRPWCRSRSAGLRSSTPSIHR